MIDFIMKDLRTWKFYVKNVTKKQIGREHIIVGTKVLLIPTLPRNMARTTIIGMGKKKSLTTGWNLKGKISGKYAQYNKANAADT